MERKRIYLRGHTDCFSYLEKIGGSKRINFWKWRRISTPLLHIQTIQYEKVLEYNKLSRIERKNY
jgi:hypothetical protein